MKPLIIAETATTPFVYYNHEEGKLFIVGKSIPENVVAFYASVSTWLESCMDDGLQKLELHIIFELVNAGSIKYIFSLLKLLQVKQTPNKNIIVKWYYEKKDKDMLYISNLFRQEIQIPIIDVIID